ncbi:hypothetical protein [Mycolicibacterium stellerae]|uniref:hypothetical protein n=1 Tax=Mycolicibacterium stellerae TaxID=2358193 RepID=UPI0013DDC905|nr:hypothetical protein [Mycolicibacterium stellerae]
MLEEIGGLCALRGLVLTHSAQRMNDLGESGTHLTDSVGRRGVTHLPVDSIQKMRGCNTDLRCIRMHFGIDNIDEVDLRGRQVQELANVLEPLGGCPVWHGRSYVPENVVASATQ